MVPGPCRPINWTLGRSGPLVGHVPCPGAIRPMEPESCIEPMEPGSCIGPMEPGSCMGPMEPGSCIGPMEPGSCMGPMEPGSCIVLAPWNPFAGPRWGPWDPFGGARRPWRPKADITEAEGRLNVGLGAEPPWICFFSFEGEPHPVQTSCNIAELLCETQP